MDLSPIAVVAYLMLFMGVGIIFLFVALLLGRFLRPRCPSPQKAETYECGEIAVGPSFLQYDLRFYVVALLFIIFEVEVALFFPPAVVFGKVNQLRSRIPELQDTAVPPPAFQQSLDDLGVPEASAGTVPSTLAYGAALQKLALAVIVDLGLFFAILLVGFAYLWNRGDIAWVRARGARQGAAG
ncbi:MAG: NADH-quinone oxidoreductase subunit A [Pirellulales bacterium]|nr:NADH-quinone oxidoreductase subunit A [Pirellulales bacterium]